MTPSADRREFLKGLVALGGASALSACLDAVRDRPAPPTGTDDRGALPARQFAWNDYCRHDDAGNVLLPHHQVFLYLALDGDGPPGEDDRRTVEAALHTLERAYEWSSDGLLFSMGYTPAYFERYDESLPGLEDMDWARRVREAGWEVSYAADAEVIHVHEETPRQVYNRYRREAIAHREIMEDDSFTFLDFCRLFASNAVADYRAALREGELPGSLLEIPRFRLMQFLGTWRGFNQETPVSDRLRQRFFYPDTEGYPATGADEADRDLRIDYSEREASIDYTPVED